MRSQSDLRLGAAVVEAFLDVFGAGNFASVGFRSVVPHLSIKQIDQLAKFLVPIRQCQSIYQYFPN
jgi:hypothetical protein